MKRLAILAISLVFISQTFGQPQPRDHFQTWGFDAELLQYGGGFGGVWHMDLNRKFALAAESNWTWVQTGQSIEGYTYYGNYIQYGTQNLSLLKAVGGATWYPFADDMDPSFQFGFYGGLGPIMAMNTSDTTTSFSRWRDVQLSGTLYTKLALEFRIHQQRSGAYLIRVGYDYAGFKQEIDGQANYQGVFLQVGMEFPRP